MTTPSVPAIGMPATYSYGSDSNPALVVSVSDSGKTLYIEKLKPIYPKKHTESHVYSDDDIMNSLSPEGEQVRLKVTLRKNGAWKISGTNVPVSFGWARYYRDPSF